MLASLRARSGLRKVVAVAAAYAVALQMVLAAVLAPQMALAAAGVAGVFVICHTDTQDQAAPGTATPIQHIACAVCNAVSATAAVPVVAAPVPFRVASRTDFSPVAPRAPPAQRPHDPRSSQGPPLAA